MTPDNPGLGDDATLFDEFSQSLVIAADPKDHVVADLNNDSLPDIAIIYSDSNVLDIFYSVDGTYSYSDWTRRTFSYPITDVAAGDMDGDLLIDLVITLNNTTANTLILDQSIGFTVQTTINTQFRPRGLVLWDFDGDGGLDIVTMFSNGVSPGFAIYFQSSGYTAGVVNYFNEGYSLGMQMPNLIEIGDFNGDSLMDLIFGDYGNGVVVSMKNGATSGLSWTAIVISTANSPTDIMLEQLDGTGLPELLISSDSKIGVWRYSNDSVSFSFITEKIDPSGITSIAAIDHNGDAYIDIVRTSTQYSTVAVYDTKVVSSNISFVDPSSIFPSAYYPTDITAEDMNSDGLTDLVVLARSSSTNGTLSIYYQNTETVSNANDNQFISDIAPSVSVVGDFDGDDDNEIAVYDASGIVRFVNESDENLGQRSIANVSAMESSDLNGDGYDDLVLVISDPSNVIIWFGNSTFLSGGGSTVTLACSVLNASSVTIGDLDNDAASTIDLAVGGTGGVDLFWSSGTGTLYSDSQHLSLSLSGSNVTAIVSGQFNANDDGDDLLDIAIVNGSASRIEIYYQQAGTTKFDLGQYHYYYLDNTLTEISGLDSSDLNDDGLDDLLTSTDGALQLYIQMSTLSTGFSEEQEIRSITVAGGVGSIALGDLDDDGVMEMAVCTGNSTVLAYKFVGDRLTGTFILLTEQTVGASPSILMLDDMDGDQKDDIVVYSTLSRTISFYYQNNFAPVAVGSSSGSVFEEGQTVTFNASESTDSYSDILRLNYTWSFGDGDMGYGVVCDHTYLINSTFTVVLTVTDPSGLYNSTDIQITITDTSPTAAFDFSPTSPTEGESVQFEDNSTERFDDIVEWYWDFGDDVTSSLKDPTHVFEDDGTYLVTLTVTDEDGSVDITTRSITVIDTSPVAGITVVTTSPTEGNETVFLGLQLGGNDSISTWSWNFGDGGTSTAQNPTHTFEDDGTYTVVLTITDSDGDSNSTTVFVVVADTSPTAEIVVATSSPTEGTVVQFNWVHLTGYDGITSWSWDFGDGGTSTAQNPTHTFMNGTYLVTLTVIDSDGDDFTTTETVIVTGDTDPTGVTIRTLDGSLTYDEWDEVVFIVTGTGAIDPVTRYSWDFLGTTFVEDESTLLNSTSHRYNASGSVKVTVRVWDQDSWTEAYIVLTISDPAPDANFTFVIGNDGLVSFSAALSSDTENDQDDLQYRWNFEGTWTEWTTSSIINHTFTADDVYSVKLEVKDEHTTDSMTRQLTIDLNPPVITVSDPDISVYVMEPIPIYVNVTDGLGIGSVILRYSINNVVVDANMTLQGGSTYFFQIPAQSSATEIAYRIIAEDTSGNVETTDYLTITVKVDNVPPVITMVDPDLEADISEPIVIYVNVTDAVGVGSVILQYTIGNVTRNVTMTLEGASMYFGQIPAQNRTMVISYRIIATDLSGNGAATDWIAISIVEEEAVDQTMFVLISVMVLAVLLSLMTYLYLSRPIVDEVFVMYHDGTLLAHQTRRMKPGMDDDILGGMLVALQNFVRDSFKDESSTVLRRMDFGERKMLVERKDNFFLAVLLSGKRAGWAPQRMQKVLDTIEERYAGSLREWDGDLEKVRGIRDDTKPMFQRGNPLARFNGKGGNEDSF